MQDLAGIVEILFCSRTRPNGLTTKIEIFLSHTLLSSHALKNLTELVTTADHGLPAKASAGPTLYTHTQAEQ